MKKILLILSILVFSFVIAAPAYAQEAMMCPGHEGDTIASLRLCVDHAYSEGHITSRVVYWTLIAKLNIAQSALDHGHPRISAFVLRSFVREVQAQSGKTIHAEHAAHLIEHAQRVIAALGG